MPVRVLNRKGQLQIGESMLVILFVLIIGAIALVFVTNMAKENFQVKIDEYEELNAVETGQIVTDLYDIRCSKTGMESTCVDKHKVQAVVDLQAGGNELLKDYYTELFKNSRIVLIEAYPDEQEYEIYASDAASGGVGQTQTLILIPVSVYDSVTDTMGFGVLSVAHYQRGGTA